MSATSVSKLPMRVRENASQSEPFGFIDFARVSHRRWLRHRHHMSFAIWRHVARQRFIMIYQDGGGGARATH